MPKMTFKHALPKIQDKLHKHMLLMWYARSAPEGDPSWRNFRPDIVRGALDGQANVERDYPVEVAELHEDETGWQHGFNSGVVAGIRYVFELMDDGKEIADSNFPSLYT